MVHVDMLLLCNESLNYIFYLNFLMHASTVKLDIVVEKNIFCSLHGGLHSDSRCGLKILSFYLHPPFHIWLVSNFRRPCKIQIILIKKKGRA
jgi:hypothetical protein